jgi:hypothetical protein
MRLVHEPLPLSDFALVQVTDLATNLSLPPMIMQVLKSQLMAHSESNVHKFNPADEPDSTDMVKLQHKKALPPPRRRPFSSLRDWRQKQHASGATAATLTAAVAAESKKSVHEQE